MIDPNATGHDVPGVNPAATAIKSSVLAPTMTIVGGALCGMPTVIVIILGAAQIVVGTLIALSTMANASSPLETIASAGTWTPDD